MDKKPLRVLYKLREADRTILLDMHAILSGIPLV